MFEGNCSKRHHVADGDDRGWWIVRELGWDGAGLAPILPRVPRSHSPVGQSRELLTYVGEIEGRIGLEEDELSNRLSLSE